MTTRQQHLLRKIGFSHLDHLKSLAYEDALSLLALHALGVDSFDSYATLKPQAEGIVKKCGGLPLALKAIGRLLRTKKGDEWDDVLNSEIWNLENAAEIVPALRLSYHDLSADLKRLFAYCSLFPKDFLFDKEELVLLWMAEGYLKESTTNKSPKSLGHEYFENLLFRSFFHPAPNCESFFVMHDLMSDLATFVAGEYSLRFDKETDMAEEALAKYRHMSFIGENYVAFQKFEAFERAKSLRTLLTVYIGEEQSSEEFFFSNKILPHLLPQLPLLRVLSLSRFNISEVPDSICSLYHLRYLNLSKTKILELPENVCNLYNLQTLIVFGCKNLTLLPKSFLKLKKLRHFDIRDTPLLKKIPLGIGELRNLQTLTKIIVGGDGDFAISELNGLKYLHGEISIEWLDKVQSSMHAREANLSLKKITKLELEWGDGSRSETLEKEVLNELRPHIDTLEILVVKSYKGKEFPNWVGDPSFHRLVHVSLHGCRKCESLPSLGRLPSLKELSIQGMDEIKVVGLECTNTIGVTFPSLEILRFEDMSSWEVWSTNSKVMFPCLRELKLKKCPNLIDVSLKALASLRVLTIDECCESVLRNLVRAASSTTKLEIRSILGLTDEVWRGVIENFGAVEELSIEFCDEIRYLWESDAEGSKVLVKLKELRVYRCKNLVSVGEDNIGSNFLSSLRKLNICSCKSVERLCCPNSVESLDISWCDSVRQVSFPRATTTTGEGGQNLKTLTIWGNDMHMEKINNTIMPMLQDISISGWKNLKTINQLSNSTHLTSLTIVDCESMESFSDLQLSNLTRLDIWVCESIESFPNLQLPNLTHLDISGCKNMKEIRDLQLPNLIRCSIYGCENLESIPDLELSNLTLLRHLMIIKCPMIEASFPGGIWPPNLVHLDIGGLKKPISEWGYQHFPVSLVHLGLYNEAGVRNISELFHLFPSSLTSLSICRFDKLESVSKGLQHITSLQHLEINGCPEVRDLPETLLPSLLRLRITGDCPKLKERCEGRSSHYWPRISHIPCISFSAF